MSWFRPDWGIPRPVLPMATQDRIWPKPDTGLKCLTRAQPALDKLTQAHPLSQLGWDGLGFGSLFLGFLTTYLGLVTELYVLFIWAGLGCILSIS